MTWHYQTVFRIENDEPFYWLIEVHVDSDGKLQSWFAEGRTAAPCGNSWGEVGSTIAMMMADNYRWKPVAYDELKPGMKLERLISKREGEALAQMVETFRHNIEETSKPGQKTDTSKDEG